MTKTVLELSNDEARAYFMRASRFCTIDLPKYFDFQPLLDALSKDIDKKPLQKVLQKNPTEEEDVNYRFLTNKDGNFAWRPLQIINPAIYICMVNRMTEIDNWKLIQDRFKEFKALERIKSYSIPLQIDECEESLKTDTEANIANWWEQIEQQSLEYALRYSTVLVTDISDCYSSIYTHSIAWALHGLPESRNDDRKDFKLIGNILDKFIQQMSYRKTNGIPQGSVLMDFIAEMVLGYADEELSKKMKGFRKIDCQILRYRDDYRIFANSEEEATKVARALSDVLSDLNLKMNPQKTFVSNHIIRDVIKPDKLYWNEAKQSEKTLQKHLLLIHSLADKYPNSGTLSIALSNFIDRLEPLKTLNENSSAVLISILADIAYNNPRVYSHIIVCIGKILAIEPDAAKIREFYKYITKKFSNKTNVGYWKVWFQRLIIKNNRRKDVKSHEKLCQIASGNKSAMLWNTTWLKPQYQEIFKKVSIIDEKKMKDLNEIPEKTEAQLFKY